MRRALVPLALAGLALAGCGGSGGTTTTVWSPGTSAPSAAATAGATSAASPEGSTTPAPAQSPTGDSTSSATASPSSSATASPTPDDDTSSSPAVHTYPRLKVTLPVGATSVPAAPPGLTAYFQTLLQKDWRSLGHTPDCRKSGVVILRATRADGFAYGTHEIDVTPRGGCMKAATMGGGYRAVWKSVDGTWKQILAMQDVPDCSTFEKWDVPSALLGKDAQCYDGSSVVAYQHD